MCQLVFQIGNFLSDILFCKLFITLQASNECFCDNSLGNANVFQRKSDNECYLLCKGNQLQICGGFLASSVYERKNCFVLIFLTITEEN